MTAAPPLAGFDVLVTVEGRVRRLHVVTHGRSTGLPVVALHGLGTTNALWHDVARDLARTHPCVLPDLLGLGRSERPRARPEVAVPGQARAVVALLDALGLERVALLGHGLGGAVAVQTAALAPQRVGAVILTSTVLHPDAWPTPGALALLLPGAASVAGLALAARPSTVRAILRGLLGREVPAAAAVPFAAGLSEGAAVRALVGVARAVDLTTTAAAWSVLQAGTGTPTLLVWGAHDDRPDPAYGRRLAAGAPQGVWVPVADAGHLLPLQRPERVAEEVAGFLADLAAPVQPVGLQ